MNPLLSNALISLLSRKFLATMTSITSATWLAHDKFIADGVYSAVMIAVVAAYVTSNVAQKMSAKQP